MPASAQPLSAIATPKARPEVRADVGVIGGSGFYEFLSDARRVPVSTPFGSPSDDLVVGELDGRTVAFVARHGQGHRFPPHKVNYRANLWALRAVGVRQVLAPCAVGSLVPAHGPGTLVVPDQVVDRTWGREHTIYDDVGHVIHVSFADPYCATGRSIVLAACRSVGAAVVDGGTLVVVNGPRFSTRAESRHHQHSGWTVVGMTGMPEAGIARELAMCYTTVALVTDLDAGVEVGEAVSQREVFATFARNVDQLKKILRVAVLELPPDPGDEEARCSCRRVLDGLKLPLELPR